jgi:hypothetical protein
MSSPSPGRPRATATINNASHASSSETENTHDAAEEMTPTKDSSRRPEKRKGEDVQGFTSTYNLFVRHWYIMTDL